jgi:two-component sensor histidine kinase
MDDRIQPAGPRVTLGPDPAQAIGMAFHELATNAGKYGALSNDEGRVSITWSLDDGSFLLSWTERDGPPVAAPSRSGFGSIVLNTLVRGSLSGEVDVEYHPEGVRWTLICPIDNLRS